MNNSLHPSIKKRIHRRNVHIESFDHIKYKQYPYTFVTKNNSIFDQNSKYDLINHYAIKWLHDHAKGPWAWAYESNDINDVEEKQLLDIENWIRIKIKSRDDAMLFKLTVSDITQI